MKPKPIVAAATPKRGWKAELATILATHNWRHAAKAKGVSHKTVKERMSYLYGWFTRMWRDPTRPLKVMPSRIREKHLRFEIERWKREQLAPATVQTYHSFLRTFCCWIEKPNLLKPLQAYFDEAHRYRRNYAASRDLSWEGDRIDAERAIAKIAHHDRYVGASLHIQLAFGLRVKESIMLRPHIDVVTAAQTCLTNTSADHYLDTHRGTKGGRRRYVPIDSNLKRAALEFARRVAVRTQDSLADPSHNLDQADRRMRTVLEKFGVTRESLGITSHGLRHQYAIERYRDKTGVPPPVQGGSRVKSRLDRRARLEIAEELGHSRTQITNGYLGSARQVRQRMPRNSPNAGEMDKALSEPDKERRVFGGKRQHKRMSSDCCILAPDSSWSRA